MSVMSHPDYWSLVERLERGERVRLRMSEEEFVAWAGDDVKAEWVDGEVIFMSPPSIEHSDIQGLLATVLRVYVEEKALGKVLGPEAPARIVLPPRRVRRRVPDLNFVQTTRLDILRKNHIEGPPDLIMEVVSPESESRDWREKYLEYQEAGVREYWIIDPPSQCIEAYRLSDRGDYERVDEGDGRISSAVVAGFFIRPAWLWTEPRPTTRSILIELGVL